MFGGMRYRRALIEQRNCVGRTLAIPVCAGVPLLRWPVALISHWRTTRLRFPDVGNNTARVGWGEERTPTLPARHVTIRWGSQAHPNLR